MFTEYDRSVLVRIDVPNEMKPEEFSNWPILNGPLPFTTFAGQTIPNVRTEDMVGFTVGYPIHIPQPNMQGLGNWDPGYFAYAVIHWNKYSQVKTLVDRGYSLEQVFLPNDKGEPQHRANTRFLRFSPGSTHQQGVADIVKGPRASFRYQPYKKHGFESTEVQYRRLTPQASVVVQAARSVGWIAKIVLKAKSVFD